MIILSILYTTNSLSFNKGYEMTNATKEELIKELWENTSYTSDTQAIHKRIVCKFHSTALHTTKLGRSVSKMVI